MKYSFLSKNKKQTGFTIIELLIVMAIIGLLASTAIVSFNDARIKARDAKRKADLKEIRKALELYYDDNGVYPQAGSCAYGSNCYVQSTLGNNWIPALTSNGYLIRVPKDPINNTTAPWTTGHYTYAYGNVSADGQKFDLTTQLENTNDPERCANRCYRFKFNTLYWCSGSYNGINCTGSFSSQIYEYSP